MTTKFTEDHEWAAVEDGVGTVGITNHAQEQLGDIVYIDLPAVGQTLSKGDEAGVVESVKAASEIYAPVSGEIVAVNEALVEAPQSVNDDAEGGGWFFKIKLSDAGEFDGLMDADAYKAHTEA